MESENNEGLEHESEDRADMLKQELDHEKRKSEELLTRLKYAQADLENYRKRTERELREAGESPVRNLVLKLLAVNDGLDLAVKHASGMQKKGELMEGIEMVQKNLWSALESAGVKRIESVGMPFDPSVHEAVERVQGDLEGEDVVVEEVRPGFMFKGQLLRPSMVKVELASRPAEKEAKVSE